MRKKHYFFRYAFFNVEGIIQKIFPVGVNKFFF